MTKRGRKPTRMSTILQNQQADEKQNTAVVAPPVQEAPKENNEPQLPVEKKDEPGITIIKMSPAPVAKPKKVENIIVDRKPIMEPIFIVTD